MNTAEKILVVDDEPQVLVALEDLLSEAFRIFKAGSAEQAREIVDKERDIAVVVTDQRMPRGTGDELLASLDGSCDARAIMLTGYADLSAVVRAVNEGRLFAYVTKPWDPSDLRVKVTNAANHFRLARQLQYEQHLLQDLMNYSPDGIYFKNVHGHFLRVNSAFARIAGARTPEELVGKSAAAVFAGHGPAAAWRDADVRILTERVPAVDMVREYPSQDGRRWVSETVAPILDNASAPIGLVGIARDVTERIRVQDELQSSERRLREQTELLNSILSGMHEGVIVADKAGRLVFFNPHAERLVGELARGHSVDDWARKFNLLKADDKTPLTSSDDPLVQAVRAQATTQQEVLVDNARSKGRLLMISAAPLSDAGGSPFGGVALLRDVTDQRALEQRVAQGEKMEAIGRLAGGVAHDFNNLLGVIQGYGELVLYAVRGDELLRNDVKELLKTTERAAGLTRKLLEFSRQRLTQRSALSLSVVAHDMVELLQRVLSETIEFKVELAADLGLTLADTGQVEQVVLNLVINARDAMPNGGNLRLSTYNPSASECHAAGLPHTNYVALSVADTGSGMPEEMKAKIFEPFFTTKPIGRGTGLGLSTVYGIVSQSEGEIRVESEVDKGTTFLVFLPRVFDRGIESSASEAVDAASVEVATILLVEDDPALRPVIARVLRGRGHTVVEAENAQRALRIVETTEVPFDLLLTDVVMPGQSGPQLAGQLRQRDPKLRVLYVSGYGKDLLTAADLEQGLVGCLEKPFTPSKLLRTIDQLLALEARRVAPG